MKYSINQLIKHGNEPFEINETVDFSSIAAQHHEIRKISPVTIIGKGQLSGTTVIFDLNIKCELVLPCALTLDDVIYPLVIDTQEIFSFAENAKESDFEDDVIIVKGQFIELIQIIWQNIIVNIPLRVVSENAYERLQRKGENWQIVDEDNQEEKIDPRFAVLKDLFKK
ncbi:MAG: hypothetical protein K0Q49_896 [Haloplasmataceae bacterium]|jgi:uncharacterized protein|nr:hypothetical protein [Haloplasmataceae bacterium]